MSEIKRAFNPKKGCKQNNNDNKRGHAMYHPEKQ